jgi:hypothetical protein
MNNEIINAELVNKIAVVVEQWSAADRPWNPANSDNSVRSGMAPWAVRSIRAGIERGAMMEIGKLTESIAPALGVSDDADFITIGEAAFTAYKNGQAVSALDIARR